MSAVGNGACYAAPSAAACHRQVFYPPGQNNSRPFHFVTPLALPRAGTAPACRLQQGVCSRQNAKGGRCPLQPPRPLPTKPLAQPRSPQPRTGQRAENAARVIQATCGSIIWRGVPPHRYLFCRSCPCVVSKAVAVSPSGGAPVLWLCGSGQPCAGGKERVPRCVNKKEGGDCFGFVFRVVGRLRRPPEG